MPTSTATTPAMPNTAAATAPRRWGIVNRPNFVTEAVWENQLSGPAMSHPPQSLCHAQAHRLQGGEHAGRQAKRKDKQAALHHVTPGQMKERQQASRRIPARDKQH